VEGLLAVVGLEVTTEGIRTTVARGEKNYENQSAFPKVVGNNVKGKGKVFPYSLPSVGPGADPGVQAVSPQVT